MLTKRWASAVLAVVSVVSIIASEKPNIVLIMADDVSWEAFGCYGAEDYETPNIDALAAEGVRFTHAYSTPICTPSRVKIMTGQYNFRNYTHFGYLNPADRTFGHMMKEAGYKTAIAGKWQLNGLYHKAEGSLDNTRPYKAGFDEYCLWQLTKGKAAKDGGGERFWSPPLEQNGTFLSAEENAGKYGPDIMSDFVCDFIERHQDEAFFVYYPTVLVHDPFVATPDTIGDAPRSQAANKQPKDPHAKKENFVAMVNYLDKIVGKIVAKLDSVGQLENTIILFTADNGTHTSITSRWGGQEIRGGKGGTTDMGTHVPFVASWKAYPTQGLVLDDPIDFTDFYATFAEAADVTLGEDDPVDGRSFLPRLKGGAGNPRDWVLTHYQPYWGRFTGAQFVRNETYKLYRDGRFYDVPSDLKEELNLEKGQAGERGEAIRKRLNQVLEGSPPAPPFEGGKSAIERPTYPDWKELADPND
ncbi:sulfatase-like hydrolase/transferase [Pelagicoccus mobilis]|uniref:Sulfatase-like hydrolase/transferase n=1 Tax=Pelagicoccus mobilis TaxID=415221 RepID=A0A934VNR9_9BACT|nr:sulfatase-like hydrolase/transferase [Pelagicoccus mobilis]MBK1876517.1 sulfatase-like hydrolase/transferase [Pelagicoccus mobilis]